MNVAVANWALRMAVYPAAATGREARVRRKKQAQLVRHSGAGISTLECRDKPWRRDNRVKEKGGGGRGGGGGGGKSGMGLAAGGHNGV